MWMIAKDQGKTTTFVGGTHDPQLRYGSELSHQLIIGEVFVRPHLVVESDHLKGCGLSGLVSSGTSPEEWVQHGNILVDPMGQFIKGGKNVD